MKANREQELMSRLSVVQKMSLSEAMEILSVSESTARRIFTKLEKDGLAIRTHGSIQIANPTMALYSISYSSRVNTAKKEAIAREACKLIEDGDILFCDSGTTIRCLCTQLVYQISKKKRNVTVYTNSLANLELLSPHLPVYLVGGEYRSNRKDFCGYLAEQSLSGLYFTKSFVGADGCVEGRLFTTTDFETAKMNEIAMHNSSSSIMLVDSSKFATTSHVSYAMAKNLNTIITDSQIEPHTLEQLRNSGARIICAEVENNSK